MIRKCKWFMNTVSNSMKSDRKWIKFSQTIASFFQPKPVKLLIWERTQKKVVECIKFQSGEFNSRNVHKYI